MGVHIFPVDPRLDDQVEAAYLIHAAVAARDVPDFAPASREHNAGQIRHPWPTDRNQHWLMSVDGVLVGALSIVMPQRDNTNRAHVTVEIHPEHRGRGHGRILYAHAMAACRAAGRSLLSGDCAAGPDGDADHAQFIVAVGARVALSMIRRRLDLDAGSPLRWDRLVGPFQLGETGVNGYRLIRWTNRAPEKFLADLAYLEGRLLLDAPTGDLEIEPIESDADRIRATERIGLIRGQRCYHSAVCHDGSDRLVGWTTLALDSDVPEQAWQQITIVDPEHRGHRLGLICKVDCLRQATAAEPALRTVHTWNAADNRHMIAVNEELGFRPVDTWVEWTHRLD